MKLQFRSSCLVSLVFQEREDVVLGPDRTEEFKQDPSAFIAEVQEQYVEPVHHIDVRNLQYNKLVFAIVL